MELELFNIPGVIFTNQIQPDSRVEQFEREEILPNGDYQTIKYFSETESIMSSIEIPQDVVYSNDCFRKFYQKTFELE
jgi:hypothetical protein